MRAGRTAIWTASAVMALYGAVFLAQDFSRVDTICRIGDIWSLLRLEEDRPGVFTEIDLEDFVEGPVPEVGDTLLTVDGLPATVDNYFTVFSTGTPAGFETQISFRKPSLKAIDSLLSDSFGSLVSLPLETALGREISVGDDQAGTFSNPVTDSVYVTTVRTRSIPLLYRVEIIAMFALRVLIAVGLVLVGLWAFARKPDDPAVRVLSLFCYALASLMVFSRLVLAQAYASFHIPFEDTIIYLFAALGTFAPPLWLHLQLLFPRRRRLYDRHRLPILAAVYIPATATAVLSFLVRYDASPALFIAQVVLTTLYFAGGIGLLLRTLWNSQNMIEMRQARLVLWGSMPGFVLFGIIAWTQILFEGFIQSLGFAYALAINNLQFLFTLAAPVSIAYALGRYRLLEVESRYRRGTLFIFVNVFVLAFFVLVVYGAGQLLSSVAGVDGTTPVLIISLSLAVGFAPAQKKVRHVIEDRFYPERKRLRALLRGFLDDVRGLGERGDFWVMLDNRLADGLEASPVIPVVRSAADRTLLLAGREASPFRTTDDFVTRLCSQGRPLLLDELLASGRIPLTDAQRDWFLDRGIALLVPLALQSGVLGFIAVGRKNSGEDFRSFELEILTSLSAQFAMAAENTELLEDRVEKEKLQEQLSIARRIQEGLLPERIPGTPGLDVDASIIFCLDVAGDYYDVIPLGNGRTLLAVGDASGKGVGPALLMASLQASLRSITDVGLTLPDLIGRVNRLVCENTAPDYFITLFTAIFDPATGELEWVNAGHNPPLLALPGGGIRRLDTGGLLLGVEPAEVYESGRTVFAKGGILLMYSDGVTEAMAPDGVEEYREERLLRLLENCGGSPAGEIVRSVEAGVESFHGSTHLADDFTVMVARRI